MAPECEENTATTEKPECLQLIELATPELYRRNLFRTLSVPITATTAEVRRQQKRLGMMRTLGSTPAKGVDGPLALTPPPNEEDLTKALERLSDPQARLLDEMFWFWPLDSESCSDAAIEAVVQGNVAAA